MRTPLSLPFAALVAFHLGFTAAQSSPPTGNFSIIVTEVESCSYNGIGLEGYHLYAGRSLMVAGGTVKEGYSDDFSIVDDEITGVPTLFDWDIISGSPAPCEFALPNAGDNAGVMYCGAEFSNSTGNYYDASASTTRLAIADIQSFWICDFSTSVYGSGQVIVNSIVGLVSGDTPTSANLSTCYAVGLEFAAPGTSGTFLDPSASVSCSTASMPTTTIAISDLASASSVPFGLPTLTGTVSATITPIVSTATSVTVVSPSEQTSVLESALTTTYNTVTKSAVASSLAFTSSGTTSTATTTSLATYTGAAAAHREAGAVLLLAGAAAVAVFA